LQLPALAAAPDPDRRPCRHPADASVPQGARLSPHSPSRQQWLVCVVGIECPCDDRRLVRDSAKILPGAAVSHAAQLVAANAGALLGHVGGAIAVGEGQIVKRRHGIFAWPWVPAFAGTNGTRGCS